MTTPEPVKLILRQQSGFGCCRCGMPIIEYHHIIPTGVEDHNRHEDMMVLCVSCHDMCTKGAIHEPEQRAYKANPYNLQQGYIDGQLKVSQDYCAITLGTCAFFDESIPFSIDGVPLLGIAVKDGRMSLSLILFDGKDRLLVEIASNDWISGDPAVWDLSCSYQKLKIRTKSGDVPLDIDASSMPMQLTAKLIKHNKQITIRPSGIESDRAGGGLQIDNMAIVGVSFNFNTATNQLSVTGGIITRKFDPKRRVDWGMAEMVKRRIGA